MSKGLIFTLSFTAGGAAGFFAGKLYFDKKYKAMYEKWHEEDLAYYDSKYGVNKESFMNPPEDAEEEDNKEIDYSALISKLNNGEYKEFKTDNVDYTSYYKNKEVEDSEEAADAENDDDDEEIRVVENDIEEPYTISPEEFATKLDYEKITFTYFKADKVFMNEDEEKEENVLSLIGERNMQFVGQYEPGVLYVRNEEFETDYEIIFEDCSYVSYLNENGN